MSLVNPLALCITIDMFRYGRDSKCRRTRVSVQGKYILMTAFLINV